MMNLYEVSDDEYGYHIAAPTRNKAKQIFRRETDQYGTPWTAPISIRILAKDVDMPEGADDDYTWASKNHKSIYFGEFTEYMTGIACQDCGCLLWLDDTGAKYCPSPECEVVTA